MPRGGKRYLLSPRAQSDLEEIWLYTLQNWSLEQADTYVEAIVEAVAAVAAGEKAGSPVDVRDGYFKYPVGSHFVFYRFSEAGLVVVRVLHRRMDIGRHL